MDVARALIAAGADVNAKDSIQDSPFLYAGAEGRIEILRLTLAAGADLRSTNRYGGTALIPAAHRGHVEAVKVLLDTRIDIDHVNGLGWTALQSLFVAAMLMVSSSAVIAKIMSELGLSDDRAAQMALAITIVEDIVAVFRRTAK